MSTGLLHGDLTDEEWREYDFTDSEGRARVYRISTPVSVYYRPAGSTHRVVDAEGVVHCVPGPGYRGCILRWKSRPGKPPVKF